jgi:hypothetical protein
MADRESLKAQGLWDFANDRPLAGKPAPLEVLVTRRTARERYERVLTFGGDGPLVAVPDYEDEEYLETLKPGESLEAALERYRLDPSVVAIRPAKERGNAWSARPDPEGWIRFTGNNRPDYAERHAWVLRLKRGELRYVPVGGAVMWENFGSGSDIEAYRPATAEEIAAVERGRS